ncbi:MAG: acyl carrier protein [Victivallales bacterium]|nr:acyl carrier protein [Victivallales bacterium]
MAETDYEARVKKIIASTLNISEEKIKLEDKIIEDLSADSLDVIELIMNLEEEFGIKIQDEESELITTVGQAVEYVQNKLGGAEKGDAAPEK